jgi:hypothetical protein
MGLEVPLQLRRLAALLLLGWHRLLVDPQVFVNEGGIG